MHVYLNVDEIMRLIAHELVEPGGKATAVALACCCKSFEDPVLDALWVEQDKPLPLLKSFREMSGTRANLTFSTSCLQELSQSYNIAPQTIPSFRI